MAAVPGRRCEEEDHETEKTGDAQRNASAFDGLAFATGSLTAFGLNAAHRSQGQLTTALVLDFATLPAARRFAQAQAVASGKSLAVQRVDRTACRVAVPVSPKHQPHPAAFRTWPAAADRAEFHQLLASAGLAMC
jgi:hypothetical protein